MALRVAGVRDVDVFIVVNLDSEPNNSTICWLSSFVRYDYTTLETATNWLGHSQITDLHLSFLRHPSPTHP